MRSGYIFCNTTRCKLELLQDWDGGKNLCCLWGSWWMSKHVFGPHPFSFELRRVDIMGCLCKIAVFRHCVGFIDHQNVIAKAVAPVDVKQMCHHDFCTKWLVSFPALYQRWVFSWFFLFRLVFTSYVMLWTADTQLHRLAPNHQLKMALLIFGMFRLLFFTVGGSGDVGSIVICVNASNHKSGTSSFIHCIVNTRLLPSHYPVQLSCAHQQCLSRNILCVLCLQLVLALC